MNSKSILLGLIGRKLSHSFSREYFTDKFRQAGIPFLDYRLFELNSIRELPNLLSSQPTVVGLNVTIPFKTEVLDMVDVADDTVIAVGAANTLLIKNDQVFGYNTDVAGFEKTLLSLPELDLNNVKALVLGTGGASKAVAHILKKQGIGFNLVTSKPHRGILTYEELTEYVLDQHKIIVNTTPLGMYPNNASFPDIPYNAIGSQHVLIDLVYNPLETQFLKFGSSKGATCVNGITMFYAQAEESWKIWKPEVERRLGTIL